MEERLENFIRQQLIIDAEVGLPLHRIILAKHLMGLASDDAADVVIMRSELDIIPKKSRDNTRKAEKVPKVETTDDYTQTIAMAVEPPQKVNFDEMFQKNKRSNKPMSFEQAAQMNTTEKNESAAANVKKCADALQTDKKNSNHNDAQKQDPYVQKLLTQGAL